MNLLSVTLRDWKAFESTSFEFPKPTASKNVILIGGKNGFGKTTLFEAIALGLFGRDGLSLVLRAGAAADEQGKAQSFKEFMERALFANAIKQGRTSCRILLEFEDDSGAPLSIERTWYFNEAGKLKAGDAGEKLKIFSGVARKPIGPSRNEQDPDGWYRDWISRTFLPTSLASFFLFDGESAKVYADRDMGTQVRDGLEGLLGLTWLRQLAKDLRDYAVSKRNLVPRGVSTDAISDLDSQVSQMEQEIDALQDSIEEIDSQLQLAEIRRDELTRELSGYGTGTKAQLEELIKEQAEYEKEYSSSESRLQNICEMDLPLALAGAGLRSNVADRLESERARDAWEASTSQRHDRSANVLDVLNKNLPEIEPQLLEVQIKGVREAVQSALESLWFPPPSNVADSFRHPHARGPMLGRILERLRQAEIVSAQTVNELLDSMGRTASKVRELKTAIQSTEVSAPQLEEKRTEIDTLNRQVSTLREQKGSSSNRLKSRNEDLEQKRKERGRLTGKLDLSLKPAQLANRAEQVAEMLHELVTEAWPLQAAAVAKEMTKGIQSMAHRNDYLKKVKINEDGSVELLNPAGRDLREFDLSAGEKQIFTQSLFSAIAEVSNKDFPLIIDTPLGRLDIEHRLNVLRFMASRPGQVILISTDTEVVGKYLESIKNRVAKKYIIKNRNQNDVAVSWAEEGYFEEVSK